MLMLLVAACSNDKPAVRDSGVASEDERFSFTTTEHLPLPYVTVGEPAPSAMLTVSSTSERDAEGGARFTVTGDFEVAGAEGDEPLEAGEARQYIVRYIGDTSGPIIAIGSLTVRIEGQSVDVGLAAVIGDPGLPDADWTRDDWGIQTTVALPSAPFPYEGSTYDDPSVLIFLPNGLADRGELGIVTHLHGHGAILEDIVRSQHLREQHALSGRDAMLIVPQGPEDASDGDFGRLAAPGGLANLVRDAMSVSYRDGWITQPQTGGVALTAHSGGYRATAAILDDGGLPVDAVHLFDALYGESESFAAFAESGGVFRSSYTASGGTDSENEALRDTLERAGVSVATSFADDALPLYAVTIAEVEAAHVDVVEDERAYARWLADSGLAHRPGAPPELLSVLSDGVEAIVTWRSDGGGEALRYRVEGSEDGSRWSLLTDTGEPTATVPATPWVRVRTTDVRYGDSDPSDSYGGTGADWLVVDGFDRVFDGSWDEPTHTFAAKVGNALGTFSVASNEAVASGGVRLADYPRVVWLLGDEGLLDRTFDATERAALSAYLDAGGTLVVSGAEVGYATDADWLTRALHTTFVSDDAGTASLDQGWDVGDVYTEDYPDVLAGDTVLWSWSTGGAAAVGWDKRVVVVGFGLENLTDRHLAAAVTSLDDWLDRSRFCLRGRATLPRAGRDTRPPPPRRLMGGASHGLNGRQMIPWFDRPIHPA